MNSGKIHYNKLLNPQPTYLSINIAAASSLPSIHSTVFDGIILSGGDKTLRWSQDVTHISIILIIYFLVYGALWLSLSTLYLELVILGQARP